MMIENWGEAKPETKLVAGCCLHCYQWKEEEGRMDESDGEGEMWWWEHCDCPLRSWGGKRTFLDCVFMCVCICVYVISLSPRKSCSLFGGEIHLSLDFIHQESRSLLLVLSSSLFVSFGPWVSLSTLSVLPPPLLLPQHPGWQMLFRSDCRLHTMPLASVSRFHLFSPSQQLGSSLGPLFTLSHSLSLDTVSTQYVRRERHSYDSPSRKKRFDRRGTKRKRGAGDPHIRKGSTRWRGDEGQANREDDVDGMRFILLQANLSHSVQNIWPSDSLDLELSFTSFSRFYSLATSLSHFLPVRLFVCSWERREKVSESVLRYIIILTTWAQTWRAITVWTAWNSSSSTYPLGIAERLYH